MTDTPSDAAREALADAARFMHAFTREGLDASLRWRLFEELTDVRRKIGRDGHPAAADDAFTTALEPLLDALGVVEALPDLLASARNGHLVGCVLEAEQAARAIRRQRDETRRREAAQQHAAEQPTPRVAVLDMPSAGPAKPAPYVSEDALALAFSARHEGGLLYVSEWGRWLQWTGTHWTHERTLAVFDHVRALVREAAAHVSARPGTSAAVARIASAATVAGVERLARADRRHARRAADFDTDLWLLNTPGGTVDLRTGDLRPNRHEDLITRCCAATPSRDDCPRWRAFLATVTGGDRDLEAYLQRFAGYALTGSTRESILAFLWGTGANGKTTFVNALRAILADYAAVAPFEALLDSGGERHPTDLAGLRGARLVVASELDEGRRWAEAKVKTLTGGDPVSARFMRGDFFTYTPQFKLLLLGNHRPSLRSVDEAIRRRLHLVPFKVTVPLAERDKDLGDKLREEWPAILRWALEGCRAWQAEGLRPPDAVTAATDEYLTAEDRLGAWLDERCVLAPDAWSTADDLFQNWRAWAAAAEEPVGSKRSLGQRLQDRGFRPKRTSARRGYRGLGLRGE